MPLNDPSPRTIRLVTAMLLVATFAAGTVTGGVLVHFGTHRDVPSHPMPAVGPMPWETLELNESQRKLAHEIMERHRPKLDSIFDETAPKVRAITDAIDAEIRTILNPEQRTRFDRILAVRRNGPPPPPPGMHPPPGNRSPRPFDGPPGPPPGPMPGEPMGDIQAEVHPDASTAH